MFTVYAVEIAPWREIRITLMARIILSMVRLEVMMSLLLLLGPLLISLMEWLFYVWPWLRSDVRWLLLLVALLTRLRTIRLRLLPPVVDCVYIYFFYFFYQLIHGVNGRSGGVPRCCCGVVQFVRGRDQFLDWKIFSVGDLGTYILWKLTQENLLGQTYLLSFSVFVGLLQHYERRDPVPGFGRTDVSHGRRYEVQGALGPDGYR